MSGSGNDFVVFDARRDDPPALTDQDLVRALSAKGTGVGADGVVFLCGSDRGDVRMLYVNADGSRAMCGNATLCAARLAVELGAASPDALVVETDAGLVPARIREARPEIDLPPPTELQPTFDIPLESGELRAGYTDTGVPHIVIQCDDVTTVDVVGRGRPLRYLEQLRSGANANFVSRDPSNGWRIRTYERGVEAETLACGTGAVAVAILLNEWGEGGHTVDLKTHSGRTLTVRLRRKDGVWQPSLSGEARIVFVGSLGEIAG